MMYSNVAHLHQFPHASQSSPYSYLGIYGNGTDSLVQALQQQQRRSSHPPLSSPRVPVPKQSQLPHSPQTRSNDGTTVAHSARSVAQPGRLDGGEHMLRRKTPNGTLSAGYDGTPVEWNARPSANKHLLITDSAPNKYRNFHSSMAASGNAPSFSQRVDQYDGDKWRSCRDPRKTALQSWGQYGIPMDNGQTLQSWWTDQPPSLDSMLHQVPPAQFYGGYQQIPTVLQPMWPPSIGPTASSAQGPFGPYWPNGAFEPYRPAAIRDSRFNSQFANISLNETLDFQPGHDSRSWQNSISSLPPASEVFAPQFPQQRQVHESGFVPEASAVAQHAGKQMVNQNSIPHDRRHQLWNTPVPVRTHYSVSQSTDSGIWKDSKPDGQYRKPSTVQQEEGDTSLHFRDKTLVWAHRVYVNLLASVQQARRNSHVKSQPNERRHSQPAYFPKPPKYSSTKASAKTTSGFGKSELNIAGEATSYNGQRIRSGNETSNTHYDNYNKKSLERNSNAYVSHFDGNHRSSIQYNVPSDPLLSQQYSGMFGASTPQYPAFNQSHIPSPVSEAQAAFEMLNRLVEGSSWRWTDGMLLGGCLAYGLGHHEVAKQWYISVLNCDSSNVEALSNLAATMTILGHQKEAERYWRHAIKLRPSYFEAIEHLVGLLCQEQRNKEAVELLENMEQSLESKEKHFSAPPWELLSQSASTPVGFDADKYMKTLSLSSESHVASGYSIPTSDNGRLIALIHAKGNMLYSLGDNFGASRAFEDAVMVAAGKSSRGIEGLIKHILSVFAKAIMSRKDKSESQLAPCETILLLPNMALKTAELVFPGGGMLPGLKDVPEGQSRKAAISVASNSLLSLAKIYQDGMSSNNSNATSASRITPGVQDILALYYLSLSLQPSPSTANNVGILLAGIQQSAPTRLTAPQGTEAQVIPGVIPGSGVALALAYYNYGLNLDSRHAHLYTNFGSLLKDIGQLTAAIRMYEQAVSCDGNFDIALANLANAVKDQGRISDAIGYYRRAVQANPEFAEAVCGLANALNSVCSWNGRGGVSYNQRGFDRWHVDEQGMLLDASHPQSSTSGWIGRVVAIVEKQLRDGESWGRGILQTKEGGELFPNSRELTEQEQKIKQAMVEWLNASGSDWEGARVVRLVERATKRLTWQIYQERYVKAKVPTPRMYGRPPIPSSLAVPSAPTVLPFHTFTCPLTAEQIRKISQRNGLRISCSTLRAPWLPTSVFEPPTPPSPQLNVGYVSSDFNNHPLAHLMQSVFGFHDASKVKAFCYATTASDNSLHRQQIQREAPVFYDASTWSVDKLVKQILDDGIHILINLNGYTRGARNEVFAARPAPIQMSFMGFAGTLGAEWCDYILADTTAIPPSTLRPYRRNVDLLDLTKDDNFGSKAADWVYGENIIFARDTFFCCDHRQSAPDSQEQQLRWADEQQRRLKMRKELFPNLSNDAVILGNFNQLYKIEPTTFRIWLRILQAVPNAVLWLLRFPDLGEQNLRQVAYNWATPSVASRIIFTDVAPKNQHIARARICDLFLDTPECNAHTTAADVLWSGTPLLTYPRYDFKMCSRMAASILKGALPKDENGEAAAEDLIVRSETQYEERAIALASGLVDVMKGKARSARLLELRKLLYEGRWTSALFDTRRWVRDLEEAYETAWNRYVTGEGGDIWL